MAKNEKYNEEDGVWRTVGGRRIFIKNGQSLSDAMKESGKFKKKEKLTEKEKLDKELEEKYGHSFPYHKDTEKEKQYKEEAQEYFKDRNIDEDIKNAKIEGDARLLINQLNDEGSDFMYGDVEIKE